MTDYESPLTFELHGRIKPFVRMTQRSMHVDEQAQQYLASKHGMGMQLKYQMRGRIMIPRHVPLCADIIFIYSGGFHGHDLDNTIKSLMDCAQGIVFEDDRWVDTILASRVAGQLDAILLTVTAI